MVPQPVFQPIRRQYNLARLQEQLHMATNGGRTNIFAVQGFGAQRIPEFIPQPPPPPPMMMPMDTEDAPGEMDFTMTGMGMGGTTTPGGGGGSAAPPSRQASVTSKA